MEKTDFKNILENYNLGKYESHKNIFTGSNTIYVLVTDKGKYLMKIYENSGLKFVKDQINLMEFLLKTKVSTPKIINTKAKKGLLIYNKKKIVFQEFIAGNEPNKFDKKLIKDISKKISILGRELQKYKNSNYDNWEKDHEFYLIKWNIKVLSKLNLKEESKILLEKMKNIDKNKLRRNIVHGDLTQSNLLVKNQKLLAFIDWDDFHEDYLIYEPAVFIAHCLIDTKIVKKELIKVFLKEYQKKIKINNEEKIALYYFIKQRLLSASSWSVNQINKHKSKKSQFLKWAEQGINKYKIFNKISKEEFLKLI